MISKGLDLIKTIEDDDDIEDYSENSDDEEQYQPSRRKKKQEIDFSHDFKFTSSYNEDTIAAWNDTYKYIKRKAKNKVDEKIQKLLNKKAKQEAVKADEDSQPEVINLDESQDNDEIDLSEDELQHDNIRTRQTTIKMKPEEVENEEDNFFEDAPPFDESITFYQMNLSRPLLKAVTEMRFTHPTPIQAATVPIALAGRDVCGCAATGTGKTAAYMLPTLERLLYRPVRGEAVTRVLVLVPTRELGVQVYEVTRRLAQFTTVEVGLAVGGLDVKVQESVLRKNPDIVIATPGRLIDHLMNTPSFGLENIEVLVLDEADRMLDEYFAEQMKEIVRQCSRTRQTLLFSATMTDEVRDLAAVSLKKPVRVFVDNNQDVASNLRQEFIRIRKDREADREAILASLVCRTFRDHAMVFVMTKKQAHRIHLLLGLLGVKVGELHGNLTQPQRLEALRRFREEQTDVLVATDVAARGLDISGVKTVINFVMPATLEHYIHRVGRTARAGRAGISVSLAGEHEYRVVKEVIKNSRHPPKSRIIPSEIISKYRARVDALEQDIESLLQQEYEERAMARAEQAVNLAEKLLKSDGHPGEKEREWFQTSEQRRVDKLSQRLMKITGVEDEDAKMAIVRARANRMTKLANKGKKGKKREDGEDSESEPAKRPRGKRGEGKLKGKKKGRRAKGAEGRVKSELDKVMALQARLAKRQDRPTKIHTLPSGQGKKQQQQQQQQRPGGKKRKKSSFDRDLTDVSAKGVKRLRYEANVQKKLDQIASKKKGGQNRPGQKNMGKKKNRKK